MDLVLLRALSLGLLLLTASCLPSPGPSGGPPGPQDGAADGGGEMDMSEGEFDPECDELRSLLPMQAGVPAMPSLARLVASPEVATDAPVAGPAHDDQDAPSIATDGSGYLILWADQRAEHQLDATHLDVIGARLDRDGRTLDPAGLPVRVSPGTRQQLPTLAFDGTNYLAVWLQLRDVFGRTYADVRAARIARDGRVLDAVPITVDDGDVERLQPAVSFDGLNYLVTWYFYRPAGTSPEFGVAARRVAPDGRVLDARPIAVASGTVNLSKEIDVAYAAGRHLVVWSQRQEVYGTRVCRNGKVLDPAGIKLFDAGTSSARSVAVASDGREFLAVWAAQRGDAATSAVQAARVLPDGTVRDRPAIALGRGLLPRIAWAGADYLIPLFQTRTGSNLLDLRVLRVNESGRLIDPEGSLIAQEILVQGPQWQDVACGAAGCMLTWPQGAISSKDIRAARLDRTGAPLDGGGAEVSRAANRQIHPAIAGSGAGYLLAWQDGRPGAPILGMRLSSTGAALDPAALPISANHALAKTEPVLAYQTAAPAGYLAAWIDGRDGGGIYAARVNPAGAVLDPMGIRVAGVAGHVTSPALACGGGVCLVVWQQQGGGYYDIFGARVSPSGAALDPTPIGIARAPLYQLRPRVAWSGGHFLAVWEDLRDGGVYSTYGARVSPAGAVLDPAGIAISGVGQMGLTPDVACDGTDCMVAYQRGGTQDLVGRRVGPGGPLPGSPVVLVPGPWARKPVLGFDRANYVLLWADARSGSSFDLYEARFTPAGAALDGAGHRVAESEFDEVEHRLAMAGGAQHLIAYRRFDMTSPLGASRVRTRLISP